VSRLTRRELVLGAGALALGASDALALPARDPVVVAGRAGGAGPRALRELARKVRGPVIRPGSAAYARAAQVYNRRYDGATPDAVVVPRDSRDVQALLRWADRHDVRVATRSACPRAIRGGARRPARAAPGRARCASSRGVCADR